MNHFEASARQAEKMMVIDLSGTLDRDAETAISAAYDTCDQGDCRTVALAFSDVDYINSTGIAVVISILARARRDGRTMWAWGVTDHYREVFAITRLSDFVEIFADEQEARDARDARDAETPDEERP